MTDPMLTNILTSKKILAKDFVCEPVFFDLKIKVDNDKLLTLLKANPSIEVQDEINGQLAELIKLRNPKKKFTSSELNIAVKGYLNNTPPINYGVWVYYPWLNKLTHILDEEEFIEVRTNRNQYKITPEEKKILSKKKIGIIGLSVGKAIALTIALERICGEIVLADFDVIELSNLNRIQTGAHNFGLKKTIIVAREISEIDPYLKVTCYHDGITVENVNDFFTKDGKLNICIEVCDGLHTKIFTRQKAKELQVPVVMNSSDRGTTDIERFDLDPNLPILHGLIDHLDLSLVIKAKTNEEKVPYLLPMLGIETSSERLKASMLEIEETITTWPQLASGVVFGGGICTDVCRRILLNQFTKSGRYFVDTEQHINDEVEDYVSANSLETENIKPTPDTNIDHYKQILQESNSKLSFVDDADNSELTNVEVKELVKHGIMAPTAGNMQPWKWIYQNKKLILIHDTARGKSILNYRDTASLIGLGAAAENVILKSRQMGYNVKVKKFSLGLKSEIYAEFTFYKKAKGNGAQFENNKFKELVDAIPNRVTNRTLGKRVPLEEGVEEYLQNVIKTTDGAELQVFGDSKKIEELKDIITEIDWIIMTNKECHSQFMHEIRWNKKEVEQTKDGLDINTFDITPTDRAGLIVARNWGVTKHLKKWGLGKEFGKMSRKAIDACSALGLITMPKSYPDSYFDGGRAIQKVWLASTVKGVAFQPLSLSTFLSERIADNNFEGLEDVKEKILKLYQKLKLVCDIKDDRSDIFLFRLSYAEDPKVTPLRRPVNDVLINE